MELAMIGLGKMGANMTERLVDGGHRVVGYDLNRIRLGRSSKREQKEPAHSRSWPPNCRTGRSSGSWSRQVLRSIRLSRRCCPFFDRAP